MSVEFTRYVFGTQTSNAETDIAYSVNDGVDTRGGSYVVRSLEELEAWAFDTYCSCPQYNPNQTTPPLPPVYPVLFSSDVVYGREHFENNLKMFRGDTYKRTFIVIQDGEYYDLTDCDIRMTFKWSLEDADADAVFTKTIDNNGITVTGPTVGEFRVNINPSDTTSLPAFKVSLWFDAQVTDVNGQVFTVAYGQLLILPDASITVP